jgi:ParB family transcriptional regulator, chromosome partitioning protein
MPAQASRSGSESRSRLGRGLAALLGDTTEQTERPFETSQGVKQVPIEFLRSNTKNPRQQFQEADLAELADSIRERGILQPILVRPLVGVRDTFEIVAGERRWRAAQQAGLHTVPVIPLDVGDREALEIAIVENVQRADLNGLEEAAGYARLTAEYGYSQSDVARVVGKSRSHIANTLRLVNLPTHARELLSSGAISAGHARALLTLPDPDLIADKIVAEKLSVRETESLGKNPNVVKRSEVSRDGKSDPNLRSLAEKISLSLGVQVEIQQNGQKHEMRIKIGDPEQLMFICERLIGG